MESIRTIKATVTAVTAFIASLLGILYVPVLLMVACNVIDYVTGLMAIPQRGEQLSGRKSINGIVKKVCMWLLVVVGAIVDALIKHACTVAGVDFDTRKHIRYRSTAAAFPHADNRADKKADRRESEGGL